MPMHDDQNNIKTIDITLDQYDEATKLEIIKQIKRKERQRRFFVCICAFVAILSLSYFVFYYYMSNKTSSDYNNLANLIGSNKLSSLSVKPLVNKIDQDAIETPDVMEKYSALYNKNKRLIGWLKIDDTLIDYPVMQTSNNEYYLEYNFNQEYDKNGSIFIDASCDIVNRNTNLILYGHNMKSGKMFGAPP